MPPAVLAAGIGLAGTVYASSQQSDAADQAAQASQYATDQSIGLQRDALGQSTTANAPYTAAGGAALDALLAQFGLGGQGGGAAGQPDWNAYVSQNSDVQAIQDIMDGKAQATPDQQNFINDYEARGAPQGMSLGQYHASVVPGRAIPTIAATTPTAINSNPTSSVPLNYTEAQRPTMAPLDISLGAYTPSPDYQYQQTEGAKTVNANYGAKGLLQSGAAMKALQEFGQNLALGDYSQWRAYTTDQYNNNRQVSDNNFNTDRSFDYTKALNDQNYATGRLDNTTNNLFKISDLGQASANKTAAAGQTYANNVGNALNSNASAIGQSAYQTADANASAANAAAGTTQNLLKTFGTSYGSPSPVTTPTYDQVGLAANQNVGPTSDYIAPFSVTNPLYR